MRSADRAGLPRREAGTSQGGRKHGWWALGGAALAYLVVGVALWWHVWTSDPTTVTTCGCGDASLFTWFLAWPAWALAHGHSLLWSRALFHPQGVNLLANTSELAFGVPLAPVTWLWGPVATLNVALTLSPVLTALTCFVLLRRWVSSGLLAFVGGLAYGFSPFTVAKLSESHLMDSTLFVLPLIVLALDELLAGSRLRPVTVGVLLGLLAAVQFFLGTELLVITAMGIGAGLVLVLAWSFARARDLVRQRWRRVTVGLATAAATGLLLLAYPGWFALAGPSHFSGVIWPQILPRFGGARLGSFVHATSVPMKTIALSRIGGGYQGSVISSPSYLGWPLLAVVAVGLVVFRRTWRLWLAVGVGTVCAALTIEVRGQPLAPWNLFGRLPVLEDVIPNRFMAVVSLCAIVAVTLTADRVGSWVSRRLAGWPSVTESDVPVRRELPATPSSDGAPRHGGSGLAARRGRWPARFAGAFVSLAVAAVAFVPIAAQVVPYTPLTGVRVAIPRWFAHPQQGAGPGDVILAIPAPFTLEQGAMTWQAVGGFRYALVGGGGPGSVPARSGRAGPGVALLQHVALFGASPPTLDSRAVADLDTALTAWQATTVVIVDQPDLPRYDQPVGAAPTAALLTAAIGRLPQQTDGAWVWTDVANRRTRRVPRRTLAACADADRIGPAGVGAVANCVLTAAAKSG